MIIPTGDYVLGTSVIFQRKEDFRIYWDTKKPKQPNSAVMGVDFKRTRPVVLWSWPCGFILYTYARDAITIAYRLFLIYFAALNEEGTKLQ